MGRKRTSDCRATSSAGSFLERYWGLPGARAKTPPQKTPGSLATLEESAYYRTAVDSGEVFEY